MMDVLIILLIIYLINGLVYGLTYLYYNDDFPTIESKIIFLIKYSIGWFPLLMMGMV